MKKFTYILSAVAALGVTATSCSDFLDTPTDTRVEIQSTEQVRMLLNSSYPQTNYAWPNEIMSDNMEDNNTPDADGLRYNLASYNRGDDEMFRWDMCVSSTDNETPSGTWENYYRSVASANAAIELLDQIVAQQGGKPTLTQESLYAEARMIRAFGHFILAQTFCMPYGGPDDARLGIPYVTKPEVTVKPHYNRGTIAETYAKIQEDIEAALPKIDNAIYEVPKYHFNTSAANAFAARFYLATRQYQKALDCANVALGGEDMSPAAMMSDIFSKLGEFYYLSDFGLYQNNIDKAGNFLLFATYSTEVRHLSGGRRYGVIRDAMDATIHGASPAWSYFRWKRSDGKGGSFTMHPCFNGCTFINGKMEYGGFIGTNVAEQFEYTDKVAGIGYAHMTRRELYAEETLLTRAEARLFLGDIQGAVDDLDIWEKARRNCPSATGYEDKFVDLTIDNINKFYRDSDPGFGIAKPINIEQVCPVSDAKVTGHEIMGVLQCIQHFRRIETLHQGMRWFDIKRYGIEFSHQIGKDKEVITLTLDDPRRATQIPAEVIAAGITANPRDERVSIENGTEKVMPVR